MYSNILVPVVFDHQPSAQQALKVAKALLSQGGKITLLHVVEEIPTYASAMIPADVWDHTVKASRNELQEIADGFDGNVDTTVVMGHSSRSILDHGAEIGADCIIIASHKPGLEDYFLGSTAARVVRHARCACHILR